MQVEFPCGDRILYKLTSSHLQVYYWSPRRTIQACNMCLCELNSVSCQSHPSTPKASDQSIHTTAWVLCILPNFGLEISKTFHIKWKGFFSSHFHFKISLVDEKTVVVQEDNNMEQKKWSTCKGRFFQIISIHLPTRTIDISTS